MEPENLRSVRVQISFFLMKADLYWRFCQIILINLAIQGSVEEMQRLFPIFLKTKQKTSSAYIYIKLTESILAYLAETGR